MIGTTGQILRVVSGAPAWGTDYVGTVTSVGGTGTVNGITLTGTVTSSGNLTLGGTLGSIANSQLSNSAVTIGSTSISLGATSTTLAGLTGVTSSAITDSGLTSGRVTYATTGGLLTDSANLQFDGSNLGIGVTPNAWPTGGKAIQASSSGLFGNGGSLVLASNLYFDSTYTAKYITTNVAGMLLYNSTGAGGWFWFNAPSGTAGTTATLTQAMVLDNNGNLLVAATAAGDGKVRISASANSFNILKIDDTGSTGGNYIQFLNSSGSNAGTINHVSSTAVLYNTTSDYRLKTVTGSVTGQGERIDALKPIDYQWTESGQQSRGFLAHEFQEVYPDSVSGTKDALDDDGKPVYQAMQASSSEVIADFVAELQSLRARVAQLETKV